MKRVLIIKMSSMGDIIHTLPALSDAQKAYPDLQFDWLVEPGFAEIPRWHPAVGQVLLAPLRQWRKAPWTVLRDPAFIALRTFFKQTHYDAIIDAQGLVKSVCMAMLARGQRYGLNFRSAREGIVSFLYHRAFEVSWELHAVERMRLLFSQALSYPLECKPACYGIDKGRLPQAEWPANSLVFLHGTTWATKHWPFEYWVRLATIASEKKYTVLLPWGTPAEQARAKAIQAAVQQPLKPVVLPKLSLAEITALLTHVKGAVAVDTGLGHIAAAMGTPTVSLYGPTDPALTGAQGEGQYHMKADFGCSPCFYKKCPKQASAETAFPPCYMSLAPEKVWNALLKLIQGTNAHILHSS